MKINVLMLAKKLGRAFTDREDSAQLVERMRQQHPDNASIQAIQFPALAVKKDTAM